MPRKEIYNSPRLEELRKKRRDKIKFKIVFWLFAGLTFLALLSFLSGIRSLNIQAIDVQGNEVVSSEYIRESAESILNGKYFGLMPKSNFLIYPKSEIVEAIRDKWKRIDELEVEIASPTRLQISIKEREEAHTWCRELGDTTENKTEQCYFMDKDGYIFDEAPFFSGSVYFKFYGGGIEPESPIGKYYMPKRWQMLLLLKSDLEAMDLRPSGMSLNTTGEVILPKSGSPGPKLLFNPDADLGKVAENLKSALLTDPLARDFKNKYSLLDYIDLRFGNKVYFKFK